MTDPSTQAPEPTPRPQLYLDELLTPIATLLIPMAAILVGILLIYACIELVDKWIRPHNRHHRTEPLLSGRRSSGTYEMDELYTNPGHNTI